MTHLAVASSGDWPNWAACRTTEKRLRKGWALTSNLKKVTCPDCLTACAGAYAAQLARRG